ncbi:MAG: hypothetical protein DRP16_04540 [Candidatus Aenigmatarchaeota archaeon]|nr:MAG: hypothetical protein DRP16_04540 [Candidatus Aenigmarchaeota archaeon]
MWDIIIVGAGPVGLYSGMLLSKGFNTLVLEEDKAIGKPLHCSGLVSVNLNRFVKPRKEFIEHKVKGARVWYKNSRLLLKKQKTAAYVINRERFDSYLGRVAEKKGCEILTGSKVNKLFFTNKDVRVETKNKPLRSRMVLGCDGSQSIVAKAIGSKPKEKVKGIIAITEEENRSEHVDIFIDKKLRDGFFWKIPRGERTEYGMWSGSASFERLERFFSLKQKPANRHGGLIPLGPGKTVSDRCILIGDAASQVKPWSGGGLVYGLLASEIAFETIKKAFEKNDFTEKTLKTYEKNWKKRIGWRIKIGMIGRSVFKKTGEKELWLLFRVLKLLNPLINTLDMDFLFSFR